MLVTYSGRFLMLKLLILFHVLTPICECREASLFNFNTIRDLSEWAEHSDTGRLNGRSKSALVIQKTRKGTQKAVFFAFLEPSSDGGCFAGFRSRVSWNLQGFKSFGLNVRGQGENYTYKIVLRDFYNPGYTYEQTFKAPANKFGVVSLPFNKFKPFFRGRMVDTNAVLAESYITSFGFQIACGVFTTERQKGTSSLEINWVKTFS